MRFNRFEKKNAAVLFLATEFSLDVPTFRSWREKPLPTHVGTSFSHSSLFHSWILWQGPQFRVLYLVSLSLASIFLSFVASYFCVVGSFSPCFLLGINCFGAYTLFASKIEWITKKFFFGIVEIECSFVNHFQRLQQATTKWRTSNSRQCLRFFGTERKRNLKRIATTFCKSKT